MAAEDPVAAFVADVGKKLKAPGFDAGSLVIGAALVFLVAVLWSMSKRPPGGRVVPLRPVAPPDQPRPTTAAAPATPSTPVAH